MPNYALDNADIVREAMLQQLSRRITPGDHLLDKILKRWRDLVCHTNVASDQHILMVDTRERRVAGYTAVRSKQTGS
jgi:hypothetical protein